MLLAGDSAARRFHRRSLLAGDSAARRLLVCSRGSLTPAGCPYAAGYVVVKCPCRGDPAPSSVPASTFASTGPRSGERGDLLLGVVGQLLRLASTGPRSGERGDPSTKGATVPSPCASTGPRSGERGDSAPAHRWNRGAVVASTGPRSGERGDAPVTDGANAWPNASTGPRSGERGDSRISARIWRWMCRFNGAALRRARRYGRHPVARIEGGLQRGRAPESAEIRPRKPRFARQGCFNGAALRRARRLCGGGGIDEFMDASTGPRSGERGDRATGGFAGQGEIASTGPRSGERGDVRYVSNSITVYSLQRGRAPESAEISRRLHGLALCGGASTGPRSGERGDPIESERDGGLQHRLQRGRAPESAEMNPVPASSHNRSWASTGPRSGERGDISGDHAMKLYVRASTGPRSGERGDAERPGSPARSTTPLQRGRAPESAEMRQFHDLVWAHDLASTGPRSGERGDHSGGR